MTCLAVVADLLGWRVHALPRQNVVAVSRMVCAPTHNEVC